MSRTTDFCDRIGLTEGVKSWLKRHEGDALREEIVHVFLDAADDGFTAEYEKRLRSLLSQIRD